MGEWGTYLSPVGLYRPSHPANLDPSLSRKGNFLYHSDVSLSPSDSISGFSRTIVFRYLALRLPFMLERIKISKMRFLKNMNTH